MTQDSYDFCIIGVGANGSLLAKLISQQGYSVIALEAGPRHNPKKDFVNDEAEMLKLFWNEPRTTAGADPAKPGCGFGVGGGTLLWCAVAPRMHESDFKIKTLDGVGIDWPISYQDLAPYYKLVEDDFGICGDHRENPWDVPRDAYPMPAIPWSWANQILAKGVEKVGAKSLHGPLAITSIPYRGREACNKCGFCMSGCLSGSKGCTLTSFVPEAEKHGAVILPESFVFKVNYDKRKNRVTGVEYIDARGKIHSIIAKVVIITAHTIETTRLLLLSANPTFPEGLANSTGLVGKNYMLHWDFYAYGLMQDKVNSFKGPILGNLMVQDWYETDTRRGFVRGYVLESSLPQPYYFGVAGPAFWGRDLKDMIKAYDHMLGWWVAGEGLPNDNNTITLDPEVKDHRGLPVARLTHEWVENDKKAMQHGARMAVETFEAAGAIKTYIGIVMSAHPMGTVRMGNSPNNSVVNPYCQSYDIPNLFICDPSVFPTGGAVNNTLTSMALSWRSAEYLITQARRGEL